MSGKTAKLFRKTVATDYEIRKDTLLKEIKLLSEKYRIDLVPVVKVVEQGIFPLIAFVDVKEKYEHLTPEAKKIEAEQLAKKQQTNGVAKPEVHLET